MKIQAERARIVAELAAETSDEGAHGVGLGGMAPAPDPLQDVSGNDLASFAGKSGANHACPSGRRRAARMALCTLLLFVGMRPVEAENGGSDSTANAVPVFGASSLTRAVDENSAAGDAVSATDEDEPPLAPLGLTVTAATATSLTLSWSAPDTGGRPPLTGYLVRYRLSGGAWKRHAHDDLSTQTTIGGLTPDSRYRVRVRAVNDAGRSGFAATGGTTAPAPMVSSVTISSQAGGDGVYAIGERIEATVTFNTAVTVTGTPRLALSIGSETRQAAYAAGSSAGTEVVFGYAVAEGDSDSDGVAVAADALAVGDGAIRSGTADATLSHAAVAADFGHKVDGVRPSVEGAPSVTSTPSQGDGHYRSLERITLEVRFSEAVTVDTAAGTPRLGVNVGANERPAGYDAGSGTATLTFSWPVKPADLDADGIAVAANRLTLRGGTLTDLAGNAAANLNHAALAAQSGHRVAGNRSPPRFAAASPSFTIAEDHKDGASVGTVSASDADGDVLTYALSGDDAGLFKLASSGAGANLSVAAGERLSHESATSHALTVTATDPAGLNAAVAVTVNVTDVGEPPVWGTAAPTLSNRFSTSVTIGWVSPDTTGKPPVRSFELTAAELDNEGNFKRPLVITRALINDGSATSGTLSGLKPSTRYDVSVSATNAEGSARSASAVFTTQPPNDPPKGYDPATCAEDASDLALSAPAGVQVELGPLHGASSQAGRCFGSPAGQASYFWDPDGDALSMSVGVESPPAAVWRGTIGSEQSPVIDAGGTQAAVCGRGGARGDGAGGGGDGERRSWRDRVAAGGDHGGGLLGQRGTELCDAGSRPDVPARRGDHGAGAAGGERWGPGARHVGRGVRLRIRAERNAAVGAELR